MLRNSNRIECHLVLSVGTRLREELAAGTHRRMGFSERCVRTALVGHVQSHIEAGAAALIRRVAWYEC